MVQLGGYRRRPASALINQKNSLPATRVLYPAFVFSSTPNGIRLIRTAQTLLFWQGR
jgi:hypothetical protein